MMVLQKQRDGPITSLPLVVRLLLLHVLVFHLLLFRGASALGYHRLIGLAGRDTMMDGKVGALILEPLSNLHLHSLPICTLIG